MSTFLRPTARHRAAHSLGGSASRCALTLVELVVVVAVVSLLASIAAPNLIEALTRSRVAAAKSNLRLLHGGLAAYRVDHNHYPSSRSIPVDDPAGILADHQLASLTTPIAYVGSSVFADPFGDVRAQVLASGRPAVSYPSVIAFGAGRDDEFPLPDGEAANPDRSFLYFHYLSFAERSGNDLMRVEGVGTISLGPDLEDSFGAFAPFPPEALPALARAAGYASPIDTLYDPTNGTASRGDLPRFSGELPAGF